eukprot:COSAG05_NODE_1447_length_4866_cov_3.020138_2_plen_99_part_00
MGCDVEALPSSLRQPIGTNSLQCTTMHVCKAHRRTQKAQPTHYLKIASEIDPCGQSSAQVYCAAVLRLFSVLRRYGKQERTCVPRSAWSRGTAPRAHR